MKQCWAYILLLLMILHNTDLKQLLKMPVLISHYQEHKQRNAEMSVMQFLSFHYWGEDLNDDDQEQDMKLPFKKVDSSGSQPAIPIAKIRINRPYIFHLENIKPIFRDCMFSQRALESLFRPPQA